MIAVPAGVRVWLASGPTDVRRGMNSLALQVQQVLKLNPNGDDLFVFRNKRGHLLKVLWADGLGMALYIKRLERGRFIWPAPVGGVVAISGAQLAMLKRWTSFTRFLEDGRICLTNNAAERALRGLALGRKAWLFAGSDRGGERAALLYSLIVTAKLNDVDPQAWLADVLARIAEHPIVRLDELLPWHWAPQKAILNAA